MEDLSLAIAHGSGTLDTKQSSAGLLSVDSAQQLNSIPQITTPRVESAPGTSPPDLGKAYPSTFTSTANDCTYSAGLAFNSPESRMLPRSATSGLSLPVPESADDRDVFALVNSLQESGLDETISCILVDTRAAITTLIDRVIHLPTNPPSLYLDLEGVYLSRHGSISILQLLIFPENTTYLVDIHTLGDEAFTTAGGNGQTLRGILESDAIPKVFFDVRNDSDALFSHFGINLAGIHDIQLMELATRHYSKKFLKGLSKCIEMDGCMMTSEKQAWKATKDKGLKLFAPEHGGSYEVFNARPLSKDIMLYCVQDVQFLPRLWQLYKRKITPRWAKRVQTATKERVALSQMETFNGKGSHMTLGPTDWVSARR